MGRAGDGGFLEGAFRERRFSYRGQGRDGRPLAYVPEDTHRSLPDLVALMHEQVETFHRETGREVGLVAESEGSLVAQAYLAAVPDAPVDRLVLLSPVVHPGRVSYPARGDDGWGVVAGWELRGIAGVVGELSPVDISADAPLLRSIVDHREVLADLARCTPRHVESVSVVPLADAVVSPGTGDDGLAVVPAFHGGLLGNDEVASVVAEVLEHGRLDRSHAWATTARVLRAGSTAWNVPDLPPRLDGDEAATGCRALAGWIGPDEGEDQR
ncbi:MAG: hypothetical protein M5U14_03190 [Acidimicrobiia bacterium]|nr:hypothetical protein [Acidimicrobiia bacterium]